MLWIVLGLVGILAGIVLMVLSHVILGVVVLLAGVVCMAMNYVTMMRGSGYDPNQGTINGMAGKGKQQSEAVKVHMPETGEKDPGIWDQMEAR